MEKNIYEPFRQCNYNSKYYRLFSMLLSLTEEQAIMRLQKLCINRDEWDKLLETYKGHNPEKVKEYNYLNELYDKYVQSFQIEKEIEDGEIKFYIKQIEGYLKSNISVIEYCSINGIDPKILDKAATNISHVNPELSIEYKTLKEKYSESFKEDVRKIANKIISSDEFDLFDYYFETLLSFDGFLKEAKNLISKDDLLELKIKINKLRKQNGLLIKISEEQILESTIIISGRKIDRKEKEKIINFLKNHNMPLGLYQIAIRKYLKNDERFFDEKYDYNMSRILIDILAKEDFELYEYVNKYISDNNENYREFWKKINRYVKNKKPEYLDIVKNKQKKYLICDKIYVQRIYHFLSGKTKDFSELLTNYKKDHIIEILNKYTDYFPQYKEQVENIINNIDSYLKIQCVDFKDVIKKLNGTDKYAKYLEMADIILNSGEDEAIILLKGYQISKDEYNDFLNKFKELFPSQKYNLKYLEFIFDKYYSHYVEKLEDPIIKKNIELIKQMVASNYSVLEYLSHYGGYNIKQMSKIFSEIRCLNISDCNDMLNILNSRSNQNLFKHLDDLVLKIYEKEDFELGDYFGYTKLSIKYFKSYVSDNIKDDEIKSVVLHKLNLIWDSSKIHPEIRESSITGVTIIKGVTINVEEKQKIYNFLKENGLPLVDTTFKYYVKKYVNGELNLGKQMNK